MLNEIKNPGKEYRVIRNERELVEKLKLVMEDPDVELEFFKGVNIDVPSAETFMMGEPEPPKLRWRTKMLIKQLMLVLLGVAIGLALPYVWKPVPVDPSSPQANTVEMTEELQSSQRL